MTHLSNLRASKYLMILQFDQGRSNSPSTEAWVEQIYDANSTDVLNIGVVFNGAVAVNDSFFINDFELVKQTTTTPEYQYNLKDHLGNVRMTFTAKREIDLSLATVEDANYTNEQSKFLNYDKARRINSVIFDHTNDGITPVPSSSYAIRLNGSDKEKIGLAKSLSVMPGDTLKIGVYAKYYKPYTATPTIAFTVLMKAIIDGMTPGGTFIDGAGYSGAPATLPFTDGFGKSTTAEEAPKAYLNWLIFDRNYIPVMSQSGFKQITVAAREDTTNSAHEHLKPPTDIIVAQAGYAYIWLSNENPTPVEVYFDDFKVEHVKSPVVQSQEYYPFGLTYNSYSKENSSPNLYQYNGKESEDELNLGWIHYGLRYYDFSIGRWTTPDPLSHKFTTLSPYNYVANNPILFNDPDGAALEPPAWLKGVVNFFKNLVSPVSDSDQAIQREDHRMAFNRFSEKVQDLRDVQRTAIDLAPGGFLLNSIIDGHTNQRSSGELVADAGTSAAIGLFLPVGSSGVKAALKGVGKEGLEQIVKKVDNIADHLTDSDVTGAVKDILGNPVKIGEKVFDHLGEVKGALKGLGKQIDKLTKNIDKGKFGDEVKDGAVRIRSSLQKEKDRIQNILTRAENYAKGTH